MSLDLLRTRHRERIFLEACLVTQHVFVVGNTNVQRSDRSIYIAAARAAKYRILGYYFETDLDAALARNSQRTGKQLIPAKGVVSTFRRVQPPALDEGFDQLHLVHLSELWL